MQGKHQPPPLCSFLWVFFSETLQAVVTTTTNAVHTKYQMTALAFATTSHGACLALPHGATSTGTRRSLRGTRASPPTRLSQQTLIFECSRTNPRSKKCQRRRRRRTQHQLAHDQAVRSPGVVARRGLTGPWLDVCKCRTRSSFTITSGPRCACIAGSFWLVSFVKECSAKVLEPCTNCRFIELIS